MTEEQAKTKMCCGVPAIAHAIVTSAGAMAGAPIKASASRTCIASECMAWRWKYGGPSTPVNHGDPGGCGLAGPVQ